MMRSWVMPMVRRLHRKMGEQRLLRRGTDFSAELSAPPRTSWDEIKRTPSSRLGAFWLSRWPTVLT